MRKRRIFGFSAWHDWSSDELRRNKTTYPMGAPDEHDGLSPITRSNSRKAMVEKTTLRGGSTTEGRVFEDRLPALDPTLPWSRINEGGSLRIPLSVPTDEDVVLEPVLRCERSESLLPLCLGRLLDFLNMVTVYLFVNETACLSALTETNKKVWWCGGRRIVLECRRGDFCTSIQPQPPFRSEKKDRKRVCEWQTRLYTTECCETSAEFPRTGGKFHRDVVQFPLCI